MNTPLNDVPRGRFALLPVHGSQICLIQVIHSVSIQRAAGPGNVAVIDLDSGDRLNIAATTPVIRVKVRHIIEAEFP